MDRLTPIFARLAPSSQLYFAGNRCETTVFEAVEGFGFIHLLQAGNAVLLNDDGSKLTLQAPCLVYYPHPISHTLLPQWESGIDLVCAKVRFGDVARNALVAAMPKRVIVPLQSNDTCDDDKTDGASLHAALQMVFSEATKKPTGYEAALNRLMDFVLISLLRYLIDRPELGSGILAALADKRLSKAVTAIHSNPGSNWTLESLAGVAGMSRARFASHFKATTGMTALDYLTNWRLTIVQSMLRRGKSLKAAAVEVGYRNPTALTRMFTLRCGLSPRDWIKGNT